jgi:HJR/Mrr/RecB family endonuclease
MIFDYSSPSEYLLSTNINQRCPMCKKSLFYYEYAEIEKIRLQHILSDQLGQVSISICKFCGWAEASCVHSSEDYRGTYETEMFSNGCLQTYNINERSAPIQFIINELEREPSQIYKLDPRKVEEIVAQAYLELGYETILTSYQGDGGIDVFVSNGKRLAGVQVKRFREDRKITVKEIREIIGALVVSQVQAKSGIFITTSDYQSGCHGLAERASEVGHNIELKTTDELIQELSEDQNINTRRGFRGIILPQKDVLDLFESINIRKRPSASDINNFDPSKLLEYMRPLSSKWR